jgi:hypothetical protein
MAQCHIQWLYLAVHGCKTYLNLNLNLIRVDMTVIVQLQAIRRLLPGLVVPTSCLRRSEGGLDGSGHGECRVIRKHYGTPEMLDGPHSQT